MLWAKQIQPAPQQSNSESQEEARWTVSYEHKTLYPTQLTLTRGTPAPLSAFTTCRPVLRAAPPACDRRVHSRTCVLRRHGDTVPRDQRVHVSRMERAQESTVSSASPRRLGRRQRCPGPAWSPRGERRARGCSAPSSQSSPHVGQVAL